jgi:hypothetical protein
MQIVNEQDAEEIAAQQFLASINIFPGSLAEYQASYGPVKILKMPGSDKGLMIGIYHKPDIDHIKRTGLQKQYWIYEPGKSIDQLRKEGLVAIINVQLRFYSRCIWEERYYGLPVKKD